MQIPSSQIEVNYKLDRSASVMCATALKIAKPLFGSSTSSHFFL